jgi:hypothetical protein
MNSYPKGSHKKKVLNFGHWPYLSGRGVTHFFSHLISEPYYDPFWEKCNPSGEKKTERKVAIIVAA